MTSFQAKVVWKRERKRENKNYSFVPSLPVAKFKIAKKFKKLKNASMACLKPEQVGKGRERKKINIVVLLPSYATRNRKF